MKTDSIFFRIFQTLPSILFELLGEPPELSKNYDFQSVEVKQTAFRIDGVFVPVPESADQMVIFAEVQNIVNQLSNRTDSENRAIIELVSTVMVYKFPELSREIIEAMFTVSELK